MNNVYKVVVGDMFYIGCTSKFKQRCGSHISALKTNTHGNFKLQKAYNNLILKKISISILHSFTTLDEAFSKEQELIQSYKDNINCTNMNIGNDTWVNSEDVVNRKENMSKGMLTYYESLTKEERIIKYGKSGALNGMYGKTQSEETKAKCRDNIKKAHLANKGRIFSEEHRKKISINASKRVGEANPFYGKQHSSETKAKIAATKARLAETNGIRITSNSRKVLADGVEFPSVTACARHYNIAYNAAAFRIKSSSFDFHYIDA